MCEIVAQLRLGPELPLQRAQKSGLEHFERESVKIEGNIGNCLVEKASG
jgi:hypothetical protein